MKNPKHFFITSKYPLNPEDRRVWRCTEIARETNCVINPYGGVRFRDATIEEILRAEATGDLILLGGERA